MEGDKKIQKKTHARVRIGAHAWHKYIYVDIYI